MSIEFVEKLPIPRYFIISGETRFDVIYLTTECVVLKCEEAVLFSEMMWKHVVVLVMWMRLLL